MGLGLLGRGLGVTKFLAECGADLIVTDLKDKKELKPSLDKLKKYKNIEYVLGRHRLQDFEDRDMIIKAAGVPLTSKYIDRANEKGIPVEMDASLFARLMQGKVTIIGVTGTRGKSTVTHLIHAVIDEAPRRRVHLGGNVRGQATLPLIREVKEGDYVVLELDSWQLQGFGDAQISPDMAVFTNFMPDHQDYYASMEEYFIDKSQIFQHQVEGNYLILSMDSFKSVRKYYEGDIRSTVAVAKTTFVPTDWDIKIPGEHNLVNIALAIQAGQILQIKQERIKRAIEGFRGVEGRLQYVKKINNREVWNDNNATTPAATIAGIEALKNQSGNLTLIMGGSDKGLELDKLISRIKQDVESVVLLPGTGTDEIRFQLYDIDELKVEEAEDLKGAFETALDLSSPGDTILFSPAFASFGQFANEYERNDKFLDVVRNR